MWHTFKDFIVDNVDELVVEDLEVVEAEGCVPMSLFRWVSTAKVQVVGHCRWSKSTKRLSNGFYYTKWAYSYFCDWSNYCDYNARNGSRNRVVLRKIGKLQIILRNRNSWVNLRCNWTIIQRPHRNSWVNRRCNWTIIQRPHRNSWVNRRCNWTITYRMGSGRSAGLAAPHTTDSSSHIWRPCWGPMEILRFIAEPM